MNFEKIIIAAAVAVGLSIASASASVITTCASSTQCSLSELAAGGTITVNDVTFDFTNVQLTGTQFPAFASLDTTFVSGIDSDSSKATLHFSFDPALTGNDDQHQDILTFQLGGTVASSSTVAIDAARATNFQATSDGDGGSAYLRITDGPDNYGFAPGVSYDGDVLLNGITAFTFQEVYIESFGLGEFAGAFLDAFDLEFDLSQTQTATIPVPAAAPLFLSALVGAGFLRKRKRAQAK